MGCGDLGRMAYTYAWLGMLLILFAGLYTLYRENIRDVDIVTSAPMPSAAALSLKNFVKENKNSGDK